MKLALFILLSSLAWADGISTPTGGFLWVSPVSYTAGNVEGEYSATMPVIFALQFGQSITSQFFFKLGDVAYTGDFSGWSFQGGLFSGTFTGVRLDYYAGTWILRSLTAISGSLSQQLNLVANCQGYACGTMGEGQMVLTTPESGTLAFMVLGLSAFSVLIADPTRMRRLLQH
jgi:hypothetical protein